MENDYDMIFKRKSMRKFDPTLKISSAEMAAIQRRLHTLVPLDESVRVSYRITESGKTTCKRGEYSLLCYSDQSERALLNAGYLLEQMDLYLASMDIGVCWHGIGKPDEKMHDGLDYIIMLAFGKSRSDDFRKDVTKATRKPREEIWQGAFDETLMDAACYAPSSCNMQPWRVHSSENEIRVFRTTDVRSAIMPAHKRPFFNTIDLGIFLYFLELLLAHHGCTFQRMLLDKQPESANNTRLIPIAVYTL